MTKDSFDGLRALLIPTASEDDGTDWEIFLLNEGLELLAAFRSIPDEELRKSIFKLVRNIASLPAVTIGSDP